MNKSSTQIRRLLISAFAALLFSGFASLKDQAEVMREVRPGNQPDSLRVYAGPGRADNFSSRASIGDSAMHAR